MADYAEITTIDVTISSSGTTSTAAELNAGRTLVGIFMPSAFTGTALTFTASPTSGGTYVAVTGTDGNAVSYTVGTSRYIPVTISDFSGIRYLKLVSGSTESAGRTITLAVRSV